jgi:hypothetical protein
MVLVTLISNPFPSRVISGKFGLKKGAGAVNKPDSQARNEFRRRSMLVTRQPPEPRRPSCRLEKLFGSTERRQNHGSNPDVGSRRGWCGGSAVHGIGAYESDAATDQGDANH